MSQVRATSLNSLFGSWKRRIAWVVALGLIPAIPLIALVFRKQPSGIEIGVIGILVGLVVVSLIGARFAWRILSASEAELWTLQEYSSRETVNPAETSVPWVRQLRAAVQRFADAARHGASGEWSFDVLPLPSQFVEPLRLRAEASALTLRWLAGAAVLLGLLGTLAGLAGAIGGALKALNESGAALNAGSLSMAMEPLKTCFVSSGLGVITGIVLSFLRSVYESELDEHLAALESELQIAMLGFFEGWQPPSKMFMESARAMAEVSRQTGLLTATFRDATLAVIRDSSAAVRDEMSPLVQQFQTVITDAVKEGTRAAAEDVLQAITRHESDYLERYRRLSSDVQSIAQDTRTASTTLASRLTTLENTMLNRLTTALTTQLVNFDLTVQRILNDLSRENLATRQALQEQNQEAFDNLRTAAENHQAALNQRSDENAHQFQQAIQTTQEQLVSNWRDAIQQLEDALVVARDRDEGLLRRQEAVGTQLREASVAATDSLVTLAARFESFATAQLTSHHERLTATLEAHMANAQAVFADVGRATEQHLLEITSRADELQQRFTRGHDELLQVLTRDAGQVVNDLHVQFQGFTEQLQTHQEQSLQQLTGSVDTLARRFEETTGRASDVFVNIIGSVDRLSAQLDHQLTLASDLRDRAEAASRALSTTLQQTQTDLATLSYRALSSADRALEQGIQDAQERLRGTLVQHTDAWQNSAATLQKDTREILNGVDQTVRELGEKQVEHLRAWKEQLRNEAASLEAWHQERGRWLADLQRIADSLQQLASPRPVPEEPILQQAGGAT